MSEPAIEVKGLSKLYRVGVPDKYPTIREALVRAASAPLRAVRSRAFAGNDGNGADRIWALRDVDFEVRNGEVLGIIGRNGAGKSTLLKILSGITEPTAGYADIYGRVGSLLEVGTGFHMELTGRENIFMNGALLGMKRSEIKRKFDEIVAFAEIEKFLDTPVKRYSSGMYMRLAFAVAAHLDPEILIVDEVLAVGDAAFQKKCLGKMGRVAQEGRTVLFVSHNMLAVQNLCDRAIWLQEGRIVDNGRPAPIVSRYLQTAFSAVTERLWPDIAAAPGNDKVRLRRARVRPVDGSPENAITVRTDFQLEFEYWNLQPGAHLNLSLHVYNEQGIMVFNAVPTDETQWQGRPFPAGLFRDVCHIPGNLLNDGMYRVELLIVRDDTTVIYRHDDILLFDVQDTVDMRGAWYGKWSGAVRPALQWQTELLEPQEPESAPLRQVASK
jgi:lipopolysaccharide transport system ATP-binding protein